MNGPRVWSWLWLCRQLGEQGGAALPGRAIKNAMGVRVSGTKAAPTFPTAISISITIWHLIQGEKKLVFLSTVERLNIFI